MKVKAIKNGFYGKLRKTGEEFEIGSKKELGNWMIEVKKPKATKKASGKK